MRILALKKRIKLVLLIGPYSLFSHFSSNKYWTLLSYELFNGFKLHGAGLLNRALIIRQCHIMPHIPEQPDVKCQMAVCIWTEVWLITNLWICRGDYIVIAGEHFRSLIWYKLVRHIESQLKKLTDIFNNWTVFWWNDTWLI